MACWCLWASHYLDAIESRRLNGVAVAAARARREDERSLRHHAIEQTPSTRLNRIARRPPQQQVELAVHRPKEIIESRRVLVAQRRDAAVSGHVALRTC